MESYAIIKGYPVFNIEQCEGLPESMFLDEGKSLEFQQISDVRQMLEDGD